MIKFCACGAAKAVGLSILTFCLGIMFGMLCPLHILAVIELILLLFLGYLCLFKW